MARKRDFKAEYARRIQRGLEKGRTRQQARGHVVKEHIVRREREREANAGLSRSEEQHVRNFYNRWITDSKFGDGKAPDEEDMVEMAQRIGYAEFAKYRKAWEETRRDYLHRRKRKTYVQSGASMLEVIAAVRSLEIDDTSWLYYH